jgi:hypothetical protein
MSHSLSPAVSAAKPSGKGRRRHPRFECGPYSFGLFQVCADMPLELAGIRNISQAGIGLTVKRQLRPGVLVTLNLFNAQRNIAFRVRMQVVYVSAQTYGTFHVGGAFTQELSPEEVQWLV